MLIDDEAPPSLKRMIYEPLTAAHDAAVACLAEVSGVGPATSEEGIRQMRERVASEAWIARDEGAVVAFALLQVVLDEAELHLVGVDPERRRLGIGKALLERSFRAVGERGASVVFLEVSRANVAAIALYEAMGFALSRVRARYYEDGSDALVMTRAL